MTYDWKRDLEDLCPAPSVCGCDRELGMTCFAHTRSDRLSAYIEELEQGLEGYRMSGQRPDRDTYDASAAFAALDALLREAERSHGDLVNDEHPVLKRLQVARQIDLLTADRDHWRKVAEWLAGSLTMYGCTQDTGDGFEQHHPNGWLFAAEQAVRDE